MSKETKTKNLIGARVDENDILNSMFTNDKDRIKFNSRAFATMSIAKAFAKTYGIELSEDVKKDKAMNTVTNIEVGQLYLGEVKEFDKNVLTFTIPGVKEELICKENFNSCIRSMGRNMRSRIVMKRIVRRLRRKPSVIKLKVFVQPLHHLV